MKIFVVLVGAFLVLWSDEVSGYFQLNGKLAQKKGVPVNLYCDVKLGYISVGGITINNKPLPADRQLKVKKECEKQLADYEKYRRNPGSIPPNLKGTSCTLAFPHEKITDDDVIRIVYMCHDQKPSGSPSWGEDKGKPNEAKVKEETIGKNSYHTLQCLNKNEIITVNQVTMDETVADVIKYPQFDPDTITDNCFKEWSRQLLDTKANSFHPMCNVDNDTPNDIKIHYQCLGPGQKKKVINSGNGNNGNNGNGNNGNNGNGNNGNNGNGNNGNNGNGNNGNNGNGNNGNGNKNGQNKG